MVFQLLFSMSCKIEVLKYPPHKIGSYVLAPTVIEDHHYIADCIDQSLFFTLYKTEQ
jgi:hypothetical protein